MAGSKQPTIRRFFKVMMPDFHTKLLVPRAFGRQLNADEFKQAVLISCKGSWFVKVRKCSKGLLYFEEDWQDFVEQHELVLGDILVFEHKEKMVFNVIVYDRSTCEKDFSHESNHLDDQNKKKKRKKASSIGQNQLKKAKSYSPKNPHFIQTMNATNGSSSKPYLNIPSEFVKATNLVEKSTMILRDPSGRLWSVQIVTVNANRNDGPEVKRKCLRKGWNKFYAANKLKQGDRCVFELGVIVEESDDAVTMDVLIFREQQQS